MNLVAVLDPVAERLWSTAFTVLGRLSQRRMLHWRPVGKQRILVVAPHPDDEVVGCAGTLLLHGLAGDSVCIAYITDGSGSRAGGSGPGEICRQRKAEAEKAAGYLQVDRFVWFGLAEGKWKFEELRPPLLELLRQTSPHLIYAPSRVDFHPEHRKVAHALSLLLSKDGAARAGAVVRVCQLQVPLTPLLANQVVDCSGLAGKVEAAFKVYRSQSVNFGRALRMLHYAARFHGFTAHAEEYWQMPVEDYCRLHDSPPDRWRSCRFRSVRYRSFSDPLSYALGWIERRRLRTVLAVDPGQHT